MPTTMQITIPVRIGEPITIRGNPCGPFLIHKPVNDIGIGEWHVTHRQTGLRFPCTFWTYANARKFAKKVQTLMDFEAIECGPPTEGGVQGLWIKGAPTKEQKEAVKALMESFSN